MSQPDDEYEEDRAIIEGFAQTVPDYDSEFRRGVFQWEQRFDQLLAVGLAEVPEPPDAESAIYWKGIIEGSKAKVGLGIRMFVNYRTVSVLDVLCATFAWKVFAEATLAFRGEVVVQRRARRYFKESGVDYVHQRAGIKQVRGRLRPVLVGFRGSVRSIITAICLTIVPLAVLSALVSKTISELIASLLIGWLIGPMISAILLLAIVRPLVRKFSTEHLKTGSDRLLINWLRLATFTTENTIRGHYFRKLIEQNHK
jgi:hypothetical protein